MSLHTSRPLSLPSRPATPTKPGPVEATHTYDFIVVGGTDESQYKRSP